MVFLKLASGLLSLLKRSDVFELLALLDFDLELIFEEATPLLPELQVANVELFKVGNVLVHGVWLTIRRVWAIRPGLLAHLLLKTVLSEHRHGNVLSINEHIARDVILQQVVLDEERHVLDQLIIDVDFGHCKEIPVEGLLALDWACLASAVGNMAHGERWHEVLASRTALVEHGALVHDLGRVHVALQLNDKRVYPAHFISLSFNCDRGKTLSLFCQKYLVYQSHNRVNFQI